MGPNENKPLSEQDFIQNGWSLKSFPFWLWLFLIAALAGVIWGSSGWYQRLIETEKKHDPFLEVTNREFSLFLWEFPVYMRVNTSKKSGYLTGFQSTSENFDLSHADEFVVAPPDLIFLYHTWHRLLAGDFIARPVKPEEFSHFLEQLPEWQPKNWPKAPQEYKELIDSKSYLKEENLQNLLPLMVSQAFQGWKNYYLEGEQINSLKPTFAQVKAFIEQHPDYARNYWRNIGQVYHQSVAGENYLLDFLKGNYSPDALVPQDQLSPFLKVALFNTEH